MQIGFSPLSYYGVLGVRQVCHDVKERPSVTRYEKAIDTIAKELIGRIDNMGISSCALIPIPQHTGQAIYTKEIAERVVKLSSFNAEVADVLRCVPHRGRYVMKKMGIEQGVEMYLTNPVSNLKNVFLIDNVIATGKTIGAAQCLIPESMSMVYAIDECTQF